MNIRKYHREGSERMKPLIYISGPITDYPEYAKRFKECELFLVYENKYTPINPAYLVNLKLLGHGIYEPTYNDYIKASLILMLHKNCNDIIFLKDWHKSKGAQIEHMYAKFFKYKRHLYFHTEKNNKRRLQLK